jgi:hypothetical protein
MTNQYYMTMVQTFMQIHNVEGISLAVSSTMEVEAECERLYLQHYGTPTRVKVSAGGTPIVVVKRSSKKFGDVPVSPPVQPNQQDSTAIVKESHSDQTTRGGLRQLMNERRKD